MSLAWEAHAYLFVAGIVAGVVNTLAGSGSLITLPVLIFAGLPATVANGTNRIAILLQTLTAVEHFRRNDLLEAKSALRLSVPALAGAVLGAALAVQVNEKVLESIIGGLMVFMLLVLLIKPQTWIEGRPGEPISRPNGWQSLVLFGIGVYGGFIQAGIGLFLLAGLVLSAGFDLVRANVIKLFVVLIYTPVVLLIFLLNDQVHWEAGLSLSVGNIIGAVIASRSALSRGPQFVRWVLIVVVFASAMHLLGLTELLLNYFRRGL